MNKLLLALSLTAAGALGTSAYAAPQASGISNAEETAMVQSLTPEQQNLYINTETGEVERLSEDGQSAQVLSQEELARIAPPSQTNNLDLQGIDEGQMTAFRGGGHGGGGFRGGRGGGGGFRGGFRGGRGGWGGGYGRGGFRGGYRGGGYYRGGRYYAPYVPCVYPFFYYCY